MALRLLPSAVVNPSGFSVPVRYQTAWPRQVAAVGTLVAAARGSRYPETIRRLLYGDTGYAIV